MAVQKLTEVVVKALPLPQVGQQFVYDQNLKGFGIRLSRGTKSFFAERRVSGKTKRITIGPYPALTVEKARKVAQVIIGELAQGIDRKALDRAKQQQTVSLAEVWTSFKQARKNLRPTTIHEYNAILNRAFPDWLTKPWLSLTPMMVAKRHAEIGIRNGPAYANLAMRVLSALHNYARAIYTDAEGQPLVAQSPTRILSTTDAWYAIKSRKTLIKPSQLKQWWVAVEALSNRTASDYLKVLLLTGLRSSEASGLLWTNIDLSGRTLTVIDTKNGSDHTLPLSDYLHGLFIRRKASSSGPFVFPGDGASGHLSGSARAISQVVKASEVVFTPHALRRTFVTTAESLDLSSFTVKKLVNHSLSGDVTAEHYVVFNIERLRDAMEKINRFMLAHAGALPSADVIQLPVLNTQAA